MSYDNVAARSRQVVGRRSRQVGGGGVRPCGIADLISLGIINVEDPRSHADLPYRGTVQYIRSKCVCICVYMLYYVLMGTININLWISLNVHTVPVSPCHDAMRKRRRIGSVCSPNGRR